MADCAWRNWLKTGNQKLVSVLRLRWPLKMPMICSYMHICVSVQIFELCNLEIVWSSRNRCLFDDILLYLNNARLMLCTSISWKSCRRYSYSNRPCTTERPWKISPLSASPHADSQSSVNHGALNPDNFDINFNPWVTGEKEGQRDKCVYIKAMLSYCDGLILADCQCPFSVSFINLIYCPLKIE